MEADQGTWFHVKPKTENKQTKKSKEEKDLNIVIPYICRCYGLKHISHTFLVYMYWGAIIILSMQIKKIEAERHSLSQSVKIQTQSPSANSTSFPITPPRLSSKSIADIQFGTMVWVVLPPILQGLRQSSKGDHNGENGVCLPGSAVTELSLMC